MAIIDSNHRNPHQIKWDTSHWPDTDSDDSPWSEIDTNYTFHATTPPPDPPTSGRGIILLAHHRWSRRKTRTKLGSNERWIAQSYSTAEGTLTILAWYGRPSTSHPNFHSERLEVLSYVQQWHRANETVLLMGDFNLSYNDSAHRLHPSTSSAHTQDNALTFLLTQGGLQDVCGLLPLLRPLRITSQYLIIQHSLHTPPTGILLPGRPNFHITHY